jgi:predicted O-linked N-acetylglucosamine transferase (SPINDLY family)
MSDTLFQEAVQAQKRGDLAGAARLCRAILEIRPKDFNALYLLGFVYSQFDQAEEAERFIADALRVNPRSADAQYNRGCLLQKLGRLDDALASFENAVALKPDYADALANRAVTLMALGRHDAALAQLDEILLALPRMAQAWRMKGTALAALKRPAEALTAIDRALALTPSQPEVLVQRGVILNELGHYREALAAFDRALALKPGDLAALINRGNARLALRQHDGAIADYTAALEQKPGTVESLVNRATAFFELKRYEDAIRDAAAARKRDAALPQLRGTLLFYRLHCCDWSDFAVEKPAIAAALDAGEPAIEPFANVVLTACEKSQWACARLKAREFPPPAQPLWRGSIYTHPKIRVAYLSADFHAHATAHLMAGVFERHDRTRFETIAMSYGPDDGSPMRARLARAFDRFLDGRNRSDADVAAELRRLEIDIAIDLKGYTRGSRPGVLACRPAPVQAHYLGYPGTMAMEAVDYILADAIVLPEAHFANYTEKVIHLPDSYQCNDSARDPGSRVFTRAEAGLSETGIVFASFNNAYKIAPEMFGAWMRILAAVEGSVLWLLEDSAAAAANLRREAQARGVAGERLVFAPRLGPADHLARHRLADLFLDTLPYGAHTTASDALWAGLPVLTVLGASFAGRVASSLLRAAGLPETIAPSLEAYESRACELARDAAQRTALKAKLARNRDRCALFDTARFTRHLEHAYAMMRERQRRGEPPAHFAVNANP